MSHISDILQKINYKVNSETTYTPDTEHYKKPEFWAEIVDGKGDCEDYALTKRKLIFETTDINPKTVRLAICNTEDGGSHCVLVVRDTDDNSDWVLDNRYPDLMRPHELKDIGYDFVLIQIGGTRDFEWADKPIGKE